MPSPSSPLRRTLLPLVAIGAIVALLALAFAWTAGWLTPRRLTALRLIDVIENGKAYPGFRRAHSKGVCVSGYFEPSAQAATLSKARVFSQARVPVLGRLSIAGGDPYGLDAQARVRSMALLLQTDDGQQWRTAMNSFPYFSVATPQGFAAQTLASRPDPATGKPDPAKMAAFLHQYPEAQKFLDWAKSAPWSNSWTNTQFNGVDAFRFIDAQGDVRFVRWAMRPQEPFAPLSAEQRRQADADFLAEDLQARLRHGPQRWDLVVTEAQPGDAINDAAQPWPEARAQIDAGTLVLESEQPQATGACRDINYDPTVLPDGIAISDDPILQARAAAYSVSFNRREREIGAGQAPQATGAAGKGSAR